MEMEEREGPIDFVWVKGHAGDKFNEQADQFAHGYATMCRDFHAPLKIPSEAQIDLMQALDPDNSAAAKADANTVGVVPVTVRHTPGTDDNHDAASPTAGDTADTHTADAAAIDTAAATHAQRVVSSERSVNSQPSADLQEGLLQAQLLYGLTATLRKATHAQQDAAERYAKAASIPPSARVADAEDNLKKAAKRQESLARVIRELVETLI